MTLREPGGVGPDLLTCDQVDERNLEAAYLAGRLGAAQAEAFEAHVFGCDRCWALLQTAAAVAGARIPRRAAGRRRLFPLPLALAAGLAAIMVGAWWITTTTRTPSAAEVLRGRADSVAVHASVGGAGISVVFGGFAGADRYRIRAFSEAGILLAERETPDTTAEIPLPAAARSDGRVLVEVTALDLLRESLASSGLIPVALRAAPR